MMSMQITSVNMISPGNRKGSPTKRCLLMLPATSPVEQNTRHLQSDHAFSLVAPVTRHSNNEHKSSLFALVTAGPDSICAAEKLTQ